MYLLLHIFSIVDDDGNRSVLPNMPESKIKEASVVVRPACAVLGASSFLGIPINCDSFLYASILKTQHKRDSKPRGLLNSAKSS